MNFNKPSFNLPFGVTVPAVSFKAPFTLKIGQRAHKHAAPDELAKEPACTTTAARQSGTSQREANIFSLQPSVSPRLIAQRTLQSPSSSRYREYRLVQRPLNNT